MKPSHVLQTRTAYSTRSVFDAKSLVVRKLILPPFLDMPVATFLGDWRLSGHLWEQRVSLRYITG